MVEIALALGVIAFALVAIIGVLPVGMSVQKDNRESTLINFDANYLMNAITSGSIGSDELTNNVIQITMTNYLYHVIPATGKIVLDSTDWVVYSTNGTTGSKVSGGPVLTNGLNIVALLSTPKYLQSGNSFYSNYVYADIRGVTASLSDLGTSPDARNFAFTYRVFPEVVPYYASDTPMASSPDIGVLAHNFSANYTQIRLRFRWPILPNGQMGNSRLTFRTAAGGTWTTYPAVLANNPIPLSVIQPGTYVGVSQ